MQLPGGGHGETAVPLNRTTHPAPQTKDPTPGLTTIGTNPSLIAKNPEIQRRLAPGHQGEIAVGPMFRF